MNGIVKVLTGVLGVLAVAACITTAVVIGYSMTRQEDDTETAAQASPENTEEQVQEPEAALPTEVPEISPGPEAAQTPSPVAVSEDHTHDYEETIDKKATCYQAGRVKYTCKECGDTYYVDVMSTGHVAGDWEILRKPTTDTSGLRVMKCIYCDEIIAQETIEAEKADGAEGEDASEEELPHVHQYTAETEREPSCILAGLRKYTCSCGDFYTEMIPAPGHVASDWDVAAEATTTKMGTEQRTCVVCGVLLDSRPINKLIPSPSANPSASAQPTATAQTSAAPAGSAGASAQPTTAPTAAPTATPTATPTPHVHEYQSYVLKEANCTEPGIRSFICTCGSSYAESIERDLNNHTYRAVVIPPTRVTQGYTAYTCIRCNYSYFDNYTPAIGQ